MSSPISIVAQPVRIFGSRPIYSFFYGYGCFLFLLSFLPGHEFSIGLLQVCYEMYERNQGRIGSLRNADSPYFPSSPTILFLDQFVSLATVPLFRV
jgi:hypothetical protein